MKTVASSINIASHLPAMAKEFPHRLAVVFPEGRDRTGRVSYTHRTFQQLDRDSNAIAHGLHDIGIGHGTRTVLMVKPSLDFFALTFALFRVGAVPVLVDPGMGVDNLGQCLEEAKPEAFIGILKAQLARRILGWSRDTIRILVTVGSWSLGGRYTLQQIQEKGAQNHQTIMVDPGPNDIAAILFTSGSTGVPKGAVYTHDIFNAQIQSLRETFDIEPGEIDLATFPLFALFAPALGMTAIIPDMDATRPAQVDPRKIIEAIDDFGVNNLFGSPALLNRLSQYTDENGITLPSLKRVISAGAPVPAHVIERTCKMLAPGVQVYTPYGATEALPVAVNGSDEILNETRKRTELGGGICVGKPVAGMDVRIMAISDDPIEAWSDDLQLPAGEIGEIVVRGAVVTRQYYNRPDSTRLAKISDPPDGFFHRMGDLGYFDESGRLWVCGRKAHRVQTPSGVMFTLRCEAIFNTHPAVHRCALVGIGEKGKQRPVLCVELLPSNTATSRNKETIRNELLNLGAWHEHTRAITTILFHPSLPVDIRHNSKIFREKLAEWAARQVK